MCPMESGKVSLDEEPLGFHGFKFAVLPRFERCFYQGSLGADCRQRMQNLIFGYYQCYRLIRSNAHWGLAPIKTLQGPFWYATKSKVGFPIPPQNECPEFI
jgi:hypothetical protein